ncbi:hypothetical protein [Rhodoligotrophos defluvii]|uniref:hypothetical protein n=1 Tax=Rhodoligotrophos defluvii TaxID=2561934 RepID=UPI001485C10E|nr:hypothetical protein [Rhodoligotrophos defluvii]
MSVGRARVHATSHSSLRNLVATRLSRPVPEPIAALAETARSRHGEGVLAVLAYGSCLRGIDPRETLADLYVLTETTRDVSRNPLSRLGCRLLPPNVYYLETALGTERFRAKYAAMPLGLFEAWVAPSTDNPYFWARFAQPCALVWVRDQAVRDRITDAVVQAVSTMVGEARLLAAVSTDNPVVSWQDAFRETYRTELRPEPGDRGTAIIAADEEWYRMASLLAPATAPMRQMPADTARRWARRRARGKLLAGLRLAKAAFTFQGGADYLAWKIERHSKVKVDLTEWQRRHPLLAALSLMPRLYRRGGFR